MIDILKAEVYCGTYAKYNNGGLEGAWMQLAKYNTWQEFNDACRELHKDEVTPEFMYQDAQYLPQEFFTESFVYPEIFQVIATLRTWDDTKQGALEAFCEDNGYIPDMFTIEEFLSQYKPPKTQIKKKESADFEEFKQKIGGDWYFLKYTADVVKVDDLRFITLGKVGLEKSFCFGYSDLYGPTSEEANEMCDKFGEKEFKEENLKKFDSKFWNEKDFARNMAEKKGCLVLENFDVKENVIQCGLKNVIRWGVRDIDTILTEEQSKELKAKYLEAVQQLRIKFERKIDAYLKKYGMSKVKKWTYWRDE